MEMLIAVHCAGTKSLRDAIVNDARLEDHDLYVKRQLKIGRNPGWSTLGSTAGSRGAIKIEWDRG
jgi:hypothetical protein